MPSGATPFLLAFLQGDASTIETLIEHRCDAAYPHLVTSQRWTPLHFAAKVNNDSLCLDLLQAKANVEGKTKDQQLPLDIAVRDGNVEASGVLLSSRADPECQMAFHPPGTGPLHVAIMDSRLGLIELLLRHRADIEGCTSLGFTPLMTATVAANMTVVLLLLDARADAHATGKDRLRAVDMAPTERLRHVLSRRTLR